MKKSKVVLLAIIGIAITSIITLSVKYGTKNKVLCTNAETETITSLEDYEWKRNETLTSSIEFAIEFSWKDDNYGVIGDFTNFKFLKNTETLTLTWYDDDTETYDDTNYILPTNNAKYFTFYNNIQDNTKRQEVVNWLLQNGTLYKPQEIWVISDDAPLQTEFEYNINFTSNNYQCTGIKVQKINETETYLYYIGYPSINNGLIYGRYYRWREGLETKILTFNQKVPYQLKNLFLFKNAGCIQTVKAINNEPSIEDLQNEIEELNLQIESLQRLNATLLAQNNFLQSAYDNAYIEINQINTQYQNLQTQYTLLLNQKTQLENQLQDLINRANTTIKIFDNINGFEYTDYPTKTITPEVGIHKTTFNFPFSSNLQNFIGIQIEYATDVEGFWMYYIKNEDLIEDGVVIGKQMVGVYNSLDNEWEENQYQRIQLNIIQIDNPTLQFLNKTTFSPKPNEETEILDVKGIMFDILSMPFVFINKAFDITLFAGTSFAINIADLIKDIIALLAILFLIKLFTKGLKAF